MGVTMMETVEKQNEIIRLQSDIISTLSSELLQGGIMTEKELDDIRTAAMERKTLEDMLF